MSNVAASQIIDSARFTQSKYIDGLRRPASFQIISQDHPNLMVSPFMILAALQLFDFLLTLCGVHHFGSGIEGNPAVRALILILGPILALSITKAISLVLIFTLFKLQNQVQWIAHATWMMNFVYMLAAIVPWIFVLGA